MANEIMTRAEAKAQGQSTYFTGKPCKHGHVSRRRTSGGNCLACWDLWVKSFPTKMAAYKVLWVERNPEKAQASAKASRIRNVESGRASTAKWAAANRDRVLERGRRWAKKHPEQIAVKTHRRRARIVASLGSHTASDLRDVLKAQKYRCAYCRLSLKSVRRHIDHIKPLSAGGSNARANLQWLCVSCNLAKAAKDPLVFAQELGRLL